jgi:hypothetical protein
MHDPPHQEAQDHEEREAVVIERPDEERRLVELLEVHAEKRRP